MGSLLKARRRARSSSNSAARRTRDKVSQGGRFASSDDRKKSSAFQGSDVEQGGRFVSAQQREQQLIDKFKGANLDELIAAQRRGEIDARLTQQAIHRGINERNRVNLARASSQKQIAQAQAVKNEKIAKQSLAQVQAQIAQKEKSVQELQAKIAQLSTPEAIAKQKEAFNRLSRAQKRSRGFPSPLEVAQKQLKQTSSEISQLRNVASKSSTTVKEATKQKQHVIAKSQFGGFSSKKAQDEALQKAIATSRQKFPDRFKKSGILVGAPVLNEQAVESFRSQNVASPLPDIPKTIQEASQRLTQKSIVSNPIKDVGNDKTTNLLAGIADPFVNFGITVANVPGAVIKEVQALREGKHVDSVEEFFGASPAGQLLGSKAQTPGSKFQRDVIEPELRETASSELLSGRVPDLSDPRKQGSVIGDLALILAPAAAGKFAKVGSKPVNNAKVIKNVKSETIVSPTGEKVWTPTNMFRDRIPRDIFDLDTATPSNFKDTPVPLGAGQGQVNPFVTTEFPLGFGLGSIVKGGGLPAKHGNFPTTKGGGTFSRPKFDEPTVSPGDKILDFGKGTQQIAKTKQVSKQVTKQTTKQKTKVIQSKQQSVTDDILFGKKRKLKSQQQLDYDVLFAPRFNQKQIDALDWIRAPKQAQKSGVKQSPKLKQKERLATGFIASSKQKFAQPQKTDQAFDFIQPVFPRTTPILEQPPNPPTVIPRPPGFIPPFFGGGIKGDNRGRRKRSGKKFIVSNIDPLRAGVIAAVGIPEQQESKSKKIFSRIDKQLARSRKKSGHTPKPISLLSDPLGSKQKKSKKTDIGLDGFDLDINL